MKFSSTKPIFITIKEYYENLIKSHTLKEGMEIPSVREVALANGVNPNTVQKAFSLLVEEGYLVSIPKKGFFVNKISKEINNPLDKKIKALLDEGFTQQDIEQSLERMAKTNDKN